MTGAAPWSVSDRGAIFGMEIMRDGGPVSGVGLRSASPLTDAAGNLPARPDLMDSEGIARLPGGGLAISFEGRMRVAIHGLDGHERRHIDPPPGSGRLPGNGGYEGLAADAQGNLYTLAEQAPGSTDPALPPFGRWRGVTSPAFLAAPATGPWVWISTIAGGFTCWNGAFRWGGFASRITRYAVGANGLGNGEVLLQTRMGTHGNLEGISLWRSGGRLIASAVADNNFRQPGATRLVEYIIPD